MIYAVYVALVLIGFLAVLNGFLRGAKKSQIDAVLSILLIGFIAAAFYIAGWKSGLIAIALAFISAIVTRPLAARLASSLSAASSGGGGGFVGLPPKPLQEISKELGLDPKKLMEGILGGSDRQSAAENALIDYCEQQPRIQAVLKEFKASRQDLQELYRRLMMAGAGQWTCGHWVAASALVYPESLRYLLARKDENIQETAYNIIVYFERGGALGTSIS